MQFSLMRSIDPPSAFTGRAHALLDVMSLAVTGTEHDAVLPSTDVAAERTLPADAPSSPMIS